MTEQWCILRVGASRTLHLADALHRSGITTWTPRAETNPRKPRTKARDETVAYPIMPTYVFAASTALAELVTLAKQMTKPCPDFSVQRYFDRYPLVADSELGPLRQAERRAIPLDKVQTFDNGERVKLIEGGFAGLSGIVQTSDGRFTLVCFPGFQIPIKISTLQLIADSAMGEGIAA